MREPVFSQIAEVDDSVFGRVESKLAVVDHARSRDGVSEDFAGNSFNLNAKSMQIESRTFNLHENLPKNRANRKSHFQSVRRLGGLPEAQFRRFKKNARVPAKVVKRGVMREPKTLSAYLLKKQENYKTNLS